MTEARPRRIPYQFALTDGEYSANGNHTAAIRERPEEYERLVVGFFDKALLRGTSG